MNVYNPALVWLLARDPGGPTWGPKTRTGGVYLLPPGLQMEERDLFNRTTCLEFRLEGLIQQICNHGRYLKGLAMTNKPLEITI